MISKSCVNFKHIIIEMLSDLDSIWRGHLGRVSITDYRVDLFPPGAKQINAAP